MNGFFYLFIFKSKYRFYLPRLYGQNDKIINQSLSHIMHLSVFSPRVGAAGLFLGIRIFKNLWS